MQCWSQTVVYSILLKFSEWLIQNFIESFFLKPFFLNIVNLHDAITPSSTLLCDSSKWNLLSILQGRELSHLHCQSYFDPGPNMWNVPKIINNKKKNIYAIVESVIFLN